MPLTLFSDPYLSGLIIGVLGNRYAKGKIDSQAQILLANDGKTGNVVAKGIEEFTRTVEFDENQSLEETILFLQSEEVAHIIRKVFGYFLSDELGDDLGFNISGLKYLFIQEYEKYFEGSSGGLSHADLEKLFDDLLDAAEDMFTREVESNNLAAHDALDKLRHLLEMNKLDEIHKEIRKLKREGKISVKKILEFEKSYREQILAVHGKIMPPSFGDTKKVQIDKIYVTPHFFVKDSYRFVFNDDEPITLDEVVENIDKTLILGNPGAGKTTLTDKLCYELSSRYDEMLIKGKRLTPIPIILRKYSEEKKKQNFSIADYIEQNINGNGRKSRAVSNV
jgi:hypothetical protein